MADNKFFTNTYVTGSGRRNYVRIDNLEDPLFTSFTFDIDYTTSPLFYTINYNDYGYPNTDGMSTKIQIALNDMHHNHLSSDQGYDILPLMTAFELDGVQLGFGLQQNVYMDLPLYGATEYIYMVDKRNAGNIQNDVNYNGTGKQSLNNAFKLGDSIKGVVSESDKEYVNSKKSENSAIVDNCDSIMNEKQTEHEKNAAESQKYIDEIKLIKEKVKDENGNIIECSESDLIIKVDDYKKKVDSFKQLKQDIVEWVNSRLSNYRTNSTNLYNKNKCVQKIFSYSDIDKNKDKYIEYLTAQWGENFRKTELFENSTSFVKEQKSEYEKFISYVWDSTGTIGWQPNKSDSFLVDNKNDDDCSTVRYSEIINKFGNELKELDLIKGDNINGDVRVKYNGVTPDWVSKLETHLDKFKTEGDYNGVYKAIKNIMMAKCNADSAFTEEFTSDKVKNNEKRLSEYEEALKNIRISIYGKNGDEVCDETNPNPESPYGKYKAAQEKYENDDYSQAEKTKAVAQGEVDYANSLLGVDTETNNTENKPDGGDKEDNIGTEDPNPDKENNNSTGDFDGFGGGSFGGGGAGGSWGDDDPTTEITIDLPELIVTAQPTSTVQGNPEPTVELPAVVTTAQYSPPALPQTVYDMLGFINGMKKLTIEYPYIFQSVTGLDTAYNKHYGIKDPYLGSGDDKITLTCYESLDLRVSSMFNRYFNAVYDRRYRRERVPINLRRFNCSIYVHDVRNFVAKMRNGMAQNRVVELTDMYYSVIEFRFYDCEIVPEETGNIFNDISNESPSEMKKTNFTFTYGNCVVNFVPSSLIK